MIAALIAAVLIVGAFAYAMNVRSTHTGGVGAGTSTSAPGTTGQGPTPPAGKAR